MNDIKPRYEHDCDNCVFLGYSDYVAPESGKWEHDLYVCTGSNSTSIIARFSNDGGSYASMPVDILKNVMSPIFEKEVSGVSTHCPALVTAYTLWILKNRGVG